MKAPMNDVTLSRADLRRADLTGAILLNNRTDGADAREAILEAAFAPGHEQDKKYLGFDDGDTRGAMIDEWALPTSGAVVVREDGLEPSARQPYPAKGTSTCLTRSARVWLQEP